MSKKIEGVRMVADKRRQRMCWTMPIDVCGVKLSKPIDVIPLRK